MGDQNDKGILLWELTTPRLLSANLHKEIEILGLSQVSPSNSQEVTFLTYGTKGHLKVWGVKVQRDSAGYVSY